MPVTRHPLMPPSPDDHRLGKFAIDEAAVTRLTQSLDLLRSKGSAVAKTFYTLLFDRYPGVRTMFPADMASQEKKLMDSIVMVVEHVREPARVVQALKELGNRHTTYGTRPEHYPIVCSILLECMAKESGGAWTDQLEAEWKQALELVSTIMIQGAAGAPEGGRPTHA